MRRAFLGAVLCLWACATGPDLPGPSGEKVHVRLLDAETLEFEGRRMDFEAFRLAIRKRVELALQGRAAPPWVLIQAHHLDVPGFGDRMLRLLQAAGVKSFSFR